MTSPSDNDAKSKCAVYYDGSCPMCTAIIGKVDESSKRDSFSMRDITKEPLPQDFTKQDVEKEIHVVGADGMIYRNADAILKMLEPYPGWRFFVWLGRLPLVRNVLSLGYDFVAANRHFLFGPASRIYWLKFVICVGLIVGVLLSFKLWTTSRFYPLTPVVNLFSPIPHPFDWILPLGLLAALVAALLSSRPKPYIWASVVLVAVLTFLDQQRLQPWVYQYAFMLVALGLFSWRPDDVDGRNTALNVSRFIVASIYFWSGVQKINLDFFNNGFAWMVAPIANLFPSSFDTAFYVLGVAVPFIEVGIGAGLLTRKFRTIAIFFALAMCVFVLWTLGPFGIGWNSVVWPWNIAMLTIVLILFVRTDAVPLRDIVWIRDGVFHKIVLVVFGVLPLTYFFNVWDSYPSWSLYSGTTNDLDIYISDRVKNELPAHVRKVVEIDNDGKNVLQVSEWTFAEFNVPPYPETRIFRSVARGLCGAVNDPDGITLVVHGRTSWFNRDGKQVWTCANFKNGPG